MNIVKKLKITHCVNLNHFSKKSLTSKVGDELRPSPKIHLTTNE